MIEWVKNIWIKESDKFQMNNDTNIVFNLKYEDLIVGILSFVDEEWTFEYSEDFKQQHFLASLVNFPSKEKKY